MIQLTPTDIGDAIAALEIDDCDHGRIVAYLHATLGRLVLNHPGSPQIPAPTTTLPDALVDVLAHFPDDEDPMGEWHLAFVGEDGQWRAADVGGAKMPAPTRWWPLPDHLG